MNRRTAIRQMATFFLTTASLAQVQQPMKFEFVINKKTADQIGLTIPQSVLFRATKVIQ